ncbi:MAG: ABC transporter ATP-binding protein [archaeon]|nr:ABC transporter ATP-binding protein [archaeon]
MNKIKKTKKNYNSNGRTYKPEKKSEKHMKDPIISVRDVWKTYYLGENVLNVLKGVSLDIFPGEFVSIIGPSGSGKSTMMNMVGVLDIPTKGKVLLKGKDIAQYSESGLAQLRGKSIGFIFQQFNLIPTLTALENVIFPTIFQGVPEKERTKRAKKLLEIVGLSDRMRHKPNELSGGQQQRVAIARALINNPEIILADEPTGNLDSISGKQVMDLLSRLHREEKKTIVLVTHDIELVKYSSRKVYIKDGIIQKITHNHHG